MSSKKVICPVCLGSGNNVNALAEAPNCLCCGGGGQLSRQEFESRRTFGQQILQAVQRKKPDEFFISRDLELVQKEPDHCTNVAGDKLLWVKNISGRSLSMFEELLHKDYQPIF